MPNIEIIILHETLKKSLISDLTTAFTLCAMIGVSVYVFESVAMQWVAAAMFFLYIFARISLLTKDASRKTPQEAANYLQTKYSVTASPAATDGDPNA